MSNYPYSEYMLGWLASHREAQDGFYIERIYVDACEGNLHAGAMLSRLLYWFAPGKNGKPRAQVQRNGFLWVAKQHGDWWEECRVNAHTARKVLDRLREAGLIDTAIYKFAGVNTVHIRINWDMLESVIQGRYGVSVKDDMEYQSEVILPVTSFTSITTDITTPTKKAAAVSSTIGQQAQDIWGLAVSSKELEQLLALEEKHGTAKVIEGLEESSRVTAKMNKNYRSAGFVRNYIDKQKPVPEKYRRPSQPTTTTPELETVTLDDMARAREVARLRAAAEQA